MYRFRLEPTNGEPGDPPTYRTEPEMAGSTPRWS